MLRAPKTYHDILYSTAKTPRGRSAAPKMYHGILYSTAKTPRGRSAALSGELGGGVAERSAFGGLASSKVPLLKILKILGQLIRSGLSVVG